MLHDTIYIGIELTHFIIVFDAPEHSFKNIFGALTIKTKPYKGRRCWLIIIFIYIETRTTDMGEL